MNIKDNMEAPDNEHENRVRKKRLFRSKIAFSKVDILFIVLVVVGFAGGVFFSILFEYLCALRAIFFGVGIACLVYQFMGGLSPDAKIKVYGLTVTGTLASLFVAILFVYYLFPGNDLKI